MCTPACVNVHTRLHTYMNIRDEKVVDSKFVDSEFVDNYFVDSKFANMEFVREIVTHV